MSESSFVKPGETFYLATTSSPLCATRAGPRVTGSTTQPVASTLCPVAAASCVRSVSRGRPTSRLGSFPSELSQPTGCGLRVPHRSLVGGVPAERHELRQSGSVL